MDQDCNVEDASSDLGQRINGRPVDMSKVKSCIQCFCERTGDLLRENLEGHDNENDCTCQ